MRSLGVIALVCTGLIVLATAVDPLQWALMLSFGSDEFFDPDVGALDIAVIWLPVLAALALGVWLIARRQALAARWFDAAAADLELAPQTLLRLALLILAIVLVVRAIPGLLGVIGESYSIRWVEPGEGPDYSWLWFNGALSAIPWLAQLVLGVLLLVYQNRLARWLWRPAQEPEPVAEPHA